MTRASSHSAWSRDRHRDERARHLLRVTVGLARHTLTGDVDLEPRPAEQLPEERLHHPHRLDAPVGDRLVAALEQAAVEADAVACLADGEVEVLVERASDAEATDDQDGDRAPERSRADDRGGRDRSDGSDRDEHRHDDLGAHQQRREQQPVLDMEQRQGRRLRRSHLEPVREGKEAGTNDRRLCRGEVREPPMFGAATGRDHAHLASPRKRPESGEITSTAWIRASGMRSDWRRMNPVSIWRLPSAIRHRVTSQEMNPQPTEGQRAPR